MDSNFTFLYSVSDEIIPDFNMSGLFPRMDQHEGGLTSQVKKSLHCLTIPHQQELHHYSLIHRLPNIQGFRQALLVLMPH